MPYDSIINRTDAATLIPEDYATGIIKGMTERSAAMQRFRRAPMANSQQRMSVLSALPTAYFVTGDTGQKQTTDTAWANKYLNAEEIAVIVPVPENVVEDTAYNIYDEIVPLVQEALGRTLDAAVFFGTNKPSSWPDAIATTCTSISHKVVRGTASQATGGLATDLSNAAGLVEADGFDVNGYVTSKSFRKHLRNARATDGQKLMDISTGTIDGEPVSYVMSGMFPTAVSSPEMFLGDWDQFILGVRKDITWKIATEGVIQDNTGAIVYNLLQQDMVALRFVMRVAWQVSNYVTFSNTTEATRYPLAMLEGPAS